MTPQIKLTTVVPVFFVDDLVNLPRGLAGAHQLANEAEEVARGLGRLHTHNGLTFSRGGTSANQSELSGVRLVVLICDVDQKMDNGATIIVAAHHLRQIGRYNGPILAVGFTDPKRQFFSIETSRNPIFYSGISDLQMMSLDSTVDQIHQKALDLLRV